MKILNAGQYLVTFQDGDHMIFSDHKRPWANRNGDAHFHDLICLATTAFWEAYLKGESAARGWLAGGGLAEALGGDASLEMKLPGRPAPEVFRDRE